jgi:hypothetical protein
MIIGIIFAIVCWFIFKKILVSVIVFYFITGINKSRLWLSIPKRYLPPSLSDQGFRAFFHGIFFWPLILIGCGGDPKNEYFRNIDKGKDHLV